MPCAARFPPSAPLSRACFEALNVDSSAPSLDGRPRNLAAPGARLLLCRLPCVESALRVHSLTLAGIPRILSTLVGLAQ